MNKYKPMVWDKLSDKDKLSMLAGENKTKATNTVHKALKIMFPKTKDATIASHLFDGHWKAKRYKEAIRIYNEAGKPFWHTGEVGRYYEGRGLIKKAMMEYEGLFREYLKMRILSLPRGPVELFKLGRWYAKRNPCKAKRYLKLYLKAEESCKSDPAFYLKYKKEAANLLKGLN
jgi:hypothetical protein